MGCYTVESRFQYLPGNTKKGRPMIELLSRALAYWPDKDRAVPHDLNSFARFVVSRSARALIFGSSFGWHQSWISFQPLSRTR
jgi:hypothetical protein